MSCCQQGEQRDDTGYAQRLPTPCIGTSWSCWEAISLLLQMPCTNICISLQTPFGFICVLKLFCCSQLGGKRVIPDHTERCHKCSQAHSPKEDPKQGGLGYSASPGTKGMQRQQDSTLSKGQIVLLNCVLPQNCFFGSIIPLLVPPEGELNNQ